MYSKAKHLYISYIHTPSLLADTKLTNSGSLGKWSEDQRHSSTSLLYEVLTEELLERARNCEQDFSLLHFASSAHNMATGEFDEDVFSFGHIWH